MKNKHKYKKDFEDCKKPGLVTYETKIIQGKTYHNLKHYHFEVCKDCKEDCNGKVQYRVMKRLGFIRW